MSEEKIIARKHIHIDNGGFTFTISEICEDCFSLEIEEGFLGYANSCITLYENINEKTIKEIGVFLIESSEKMNKNNVLKFKRS